EGMAWAALKPVVKACIGGSLIGITVSDRYFSVAAVHGGSMRPTLDGTTADGREYAVVKRSPLYDYSRGEVVVFVSPADHRSRTIKRLIGLPGDWISVPDKEEIRQIPEGHCWVEGDNGSASWDSRSYGPVPLGLVQGRVTHVVWPPSKMGRVDKRVPPEGRVMPQRNL
uniref:Mitochondrial inner membrane protease subunit 2 n=2 Tax=Aegilops tauschii subsp. strangulata TaxID=200361 RepID=A0A452XBG9_AEGTS